MVDQIETTVKNYRDFSEYMHLSPNNLPDFMDEFDAEVIADCLAVNYVLPLTVWGQIASWDRRFKRESLSSFKYLRDCNITPNDLEAILSHRHDDFSPDKLILRLPF